MNIRNTREIKANAALRVGCALQEKKIVLIYSGLVAGLSLLSLVVRFVLGLQIDQLGGLSNMSTRTMLSTLQSMIPLLQALAIMCLDVGYLSTMLRISREQYASANGLRLGFDRFWVLLRSSIIQGLIYTGMAIASVYAAAILFVMSPWGAEFMEQMAPMMAEVSLLSPQVAMDEATAMSLVPSMLPMFIMTLILGLVLMIPVSLRLRMVNYVIIDKPGRGALYALRESRKMMHGNCLSLLKLELSFWWYILLQLALTCVGNADLWLPVVGVELPMNADVAYFLFYALYLGLQLVVFYFLRNKVEVSYCLFYNAIKPEEQTDGVVLGNIFQM